MICKEGYNTVRKALADNIKWVAIQDSCKKQLACIHVFCAPQLVQNSLAISFVLDQHQSAFKLHDKDLTCLFLNEAKQPLLQIPLQHCSIGGNVGSVFRIFIKIGE